MYLKAVYGGGLYDSLASGGGDVRLLKLISIDLSPYIVRKYLIRSPFGNEGVDYKYKQLRRFMFRSFSIKATLFSGRCLAC